MIRSTQEGRNTCSRRCHRHTFRYFHMDRWNIRPHLLHENHLFDSQLMFKYPDDARVILLRYVSWCRGIDFFIRRNTSHWITFVKQQLARHESHRHLLLSYLIFIILKAGLFIRSCSNGQKSQMKKSKHQISIFHFILNESCKPGATFKL